MKYVSVDVAHSGHCHNEVQLKVSVKWSNVAELSNSNQMLHHHDWNQIAFHESAYYEYYKQIKYTYMVFHTCCHKCHLSFFRRTVALMDSPLPWSSGHCCRFCDIGLVRMRHFGFSGVWVIAERSVVKARTTVAMEADAALCCTYLAKRMAVAAEQQWGA